MVFLVIAGPGPKLSMPYASWIGIEIENENLRSRISIGYGSELEIFFLCFRYMSRQLILKVSIINFLKRKCK